MTRELDADRLRTLFTRAAMALALYGRHAGLCAKDVTSSPKVPCSCGFDAAYDGVFFEDLEVEGVRAALAKAGAP
jgi:hypothetical protein